MVTIFNEVLYRPILNSLVWLVNVVPGHSAGLAIIILTVVIRAILIPLSWKSIKSQQAMQALQPKIAEIQKKYANDKEKQTKAIMEFYKENKINPFSGCLPLLIQLPILIALFRVLRSGLDGIAVESLYSFISRPEAINTMFLGIFDLNASRVLPLAILAGALQFLQSKMLMPKKQATSKKKDFSHIMTSQMTYLMPLLTVYIAWTLPAGLALYWTTTTVFAVGQQYVMKKMGKKPEEKKI